MTNPDYWVRQIQGDAGSIGPDQAMAAMRRIQSNTASGLFPTTGGAVSLMHRDDVETLYRANRGLFPKFRPRLPDRGGKPAKSLNDWYAAAIEQALFHGQKPFDRRQAEAMDGFLHTYHSSDIDWKRVHAFATSLDASVPAMGQGQYWTANSPKEPMSVSAFLGPVGL